MEGENISGSDEIGQLRARWLRRDHAELARAAVSAIKRGRSLGQVPGLSQVQERWDLRGLTFRLPAIRRTIWDMLNNSLTFKSTFIRDTDLSYADADDTRWESCQLSNVVFDDANLSGIILNSCDVTSASFRGTDLRAGVFGVKSLTSATEFSKCVFADADMRGTGHWITSYRDCVFSAANLHNVDFDGARFTHCSFAGLVFGASFHSRSTLITLSGRFPHPEAAQPNKMLSVDFSAANLRGVNFEGVDLSSCRFPNDGRHLVVRRQHDVFEEARAIVSKEWTGEQREAALTYLEWNHLTPNIVPNSGITEAKLRQPIDVINLDDLIEYIDPITGPRLFDLIRSIAE